MNPENLVKKIKALARADARKRRDPRFLDTMGFLVAKGFLKTDLDLKRQPNRRLRIEDVIWAGENVEPRILEVLPAAVFRLAKHFDLDPAKHPELFAICEHFKHDDKQGEPFFDVPYPKAKAWMNLQLADKRTKTATEKKVAKNYRLKPEVVNHLKELAEKQGATETEVLEELISRAR